MSFLLGRFRIRTLLSGWSCSLSTGDWGLWKSSLAVDIHFASNLVDTLLSVFNHFDSLFPFLFKSCFCALNLLSFNLNPPINGFLFGLIRARTALILLEQTLYVLSFSTLFKFEHLFFELYQLRMFTVSHNCAQLLLRVLLERVPIKHAARRLTRCIKILHLLPRFAVTTIFALFFSKILTKAWLLEYIFGTTWFNRHLDISDVKVWTFLGGYMSGRVRLLLHVDFSLAR